MAIVDEVLKLVNRHGPTALVHILLLVWLTLFVIDPAQLPEGALLWREASANVRAVLAALGLSLDLWYVIAALLIAYFTAFEWIGRLIASLPGLRIVTRTRFAPELLANMCAWLGLEPEPYRVTKAINDEVDARLARVRQMGEADPYQWLLDRETYLRSYYRSVLIALLAMIAWALAGADYAPGRGPVLLTAGLLAAIALGLKWYVGRTVNQRATYLAYWAMAEKIDYTPQEGWELRRALENTVLHRISIAEALERTPYQVVMRLLEWLPKTRRDALRRRVPHPLVDWDDDWRLVQASERRFAEDAPVRAQALDAAPFAGRFSALVERPGSGLFILVPRDSGLALAAAGEGAQYSFATRAHGGPPPALVLAATHAGLDDPDARLSLQLGVGERGCLVPAGEHRIEALLSGSAPDHREGWSKLLWEPEALRDSLLGWENWSDKVMIGEIEAGLGAPLKSGQSYLAVVCTGRGLALNIALQAFRIGDSQRLLVAWGMRRVRAGEREPAELPRPWWDWRAWRELVRRYREEEALRRPKA